MHAFLHLCKTRIQETGVTKTGSGVNELGCQTYYIQMKTVHRETRLVRVLPELWHPLETAAGQEIKHSKKGEKKNEKRLIDVKTELCCHIDAGYRAKNTCTLISVEGTKGSTRAVEQIMHCYILLWLPGLAYICLSRGLLSAAEGRRGGEKKLKKNTSLSMLLCLPPATCR